MATVGDEMNLGGVVVRVVKMTREVWDSAASCCDLCPLNEPAMDACRTYDHHPFDCTNLPARCVAAYVCEIPRLTLKGVLE